MNIAAAANAIINEFSIVYFPTSWMVLHILWKFLIGSSLGAKDKHKLHNSLIITTFWSLIISLVCTLIFAMFGEKIIHFMSSIGEVRATSKVYLPWLIAFPIISMWSFLLDGLFVGALLEEKCVMELSLPLLFTLSHMGFYIIMIIMLYLGEYVNFYDYTMDRSCLHSQVKTNKNMNYFIISLS